MGMIVFIAALGFVLFLDPAFQQQRQAFANAARPLKDHAEVLAAFLRRAPHIFSHWRDKFQYLMA